MSALALEAFRPVVFKPACWHLGPAAELLLPRIREADELARAPRRWLERGVDALLMASGKSNWREDKATNALLNAAAFAGPATVYFAFWTTAAATDLDAYHGGTAGEVSGGSYDRVSKVANTTNFPTASGAAIANGTAVTFPTATADWASAATIKQVLVLDANNKTSADHLELWADVTVAKTVLNGDTASFAVSAFTYTEN